MMQNLICNFYLSHQRSGLTNSSNGTEHFDVRIERSKLKQYWKICITFVVWHVIPFVAEECLEITILPERIAARLGSI